MESWSSEKGHELDAASIEFKQIEVIILIHFHLYLSLNSTYAISRRRFCFN